MKLKHVTLLLCAVWLCAHSFAQPLIKDQKVIGGIGSDECTVTYVTSDGGLILGGHSTSKSSGQKTENSKGDKDYWIVKLDSKWNIEWDKTIGGRYQEYLYALQQTSDGGYILGGHSVSHISGDKTENSKGYYDYWVVKLDSTGNKLWDRTIGGSSTEYLHALQQTADGGYILGGYSNSGISGDKTEDSKGYNDYWIVKLDSLGNKVWDKTIGSKGHDYLFALRQTADGGYILGGHSLSDISGDKTQNSRAGSWDYWVVKLDSVGGKMWDRTIGGWGIDNLSTLQQTKDGGYILGGYSYSGKSGEKTEPNKDGVGTYPDYWLVKLNKTGDKVWDKTIGGNRSDVQTSIVQTTDGGYLLGGYSHSGISGDKTDSSRGVYDYWVVKTDRRGVIQWDKTIGGGNYDECYSVQELKKNLYAATGRSMSGISGDKTGGNRGRGIWDYWIVKLKYEQPPATTSITAAPSVTERKIAPEIPGSTFSAFPNPARDEITIQATGKGTFTLTNAQGKLIATQTINGTGAMRVAHLPAGVYYLKNTATGAAKQVTVMK